jgi:hypothetical protein
VVFFACLAPELCIDCRTQKYRKGAKEKQRSHQSGLRKRADISGREYADALNQTRV